MESETKKSEEDEISTSFDFFVSDSTEIRFTVFRYEYRPIFIFRKIGLPIIQQDTTVKELKI